MFSKDCSQQHKERDVFRISEAFTSAHRSPEEDVGGVKLPHTVGFLFEERWRPDGGLLHRGDARVFRFGPTSRINVSSQIQELLAGAANS